MNTRNYQCVYATAQIFFKKKMNEKFDDLDNVRAYIDDILIISNGFLEDHIEKLNKFSNKLKLADFKVSVEKPFFARNELEYLGFKFTKGSIMPLPDKV